MKQIIKMSVDEYDELVSKVKGKTDRRFLKKLRKMLGSKTNREIIDHIRAVKEMLSDKINAVDKLNDFVNEKDEQVILLKEQVARLKEQVSALQGYQQVSVKRNKYLSRMKYGVTRNTGANGTRPTDGPHAVFKDSDAAYTWEQQYPYGGIVDVLDDAKNCLDEMRERGDTILPKSCPSCKLGPCFFKKS